MRMKYESCYEENKNDTTDSANKSVGVERKRVSKKKTISYFRKSELLLLICKRTTNKNET